MIITAYNPYTDDLERTYLADSYDSGQTSIEVKTNTQFANNDRILIGDLGIEQTEIVTVTAVPDANGTTLTIGATLYPHPANTPIYILQFDQVKFYRSTTGVDGTYSLLSTVDLDVTNSNLVTNYNDDTATTGYYYEISMYNSVSTVESSKSDPIPATTGWTRKQVGYLIDQILEELSDPNEQNITRKELIGYFNEVNDDLLMQVVRPYNFLLTRQVFGRTAGRNVLAYPTDSNGNQLMWKFDHMDYNFIDNTTNPTTNNTWTVEVAPSLEYFRNRWITNENDTATQDDSVQEIALDEANKQFVYYPYSKTTSTAVWYLYYYTYFTEITSEGDVIQTPTPRIYKLYSFYKYYLKRSVTEPTYLQMANAHLQQYTMEKARYKSQDRRDAGTPRRFEGEGWVHKSFRR